LKRALITGASSGIGEALARLLAHKGFSLLLTGRNQKKLEALSSELHTEEVFFVDLNDADARKKIVSLIYEKTPELVVNNAGFGLYGDVMSLSVEEQLAILEVNAAAALELTLEAARALIKANKKGVILNVSSVAGEFPCPGMSVYGASKAFLTSLSRALNTELSSQGIAVLVSCPGMVATDFANRAAKKAVHTKGSPVLTPQFAAEQIWRQIEKKEEMHIFNWQYRLASWFVKYFALTSLVKKIIWNQIKKRI
jgi:short-subunit dehydrogenase